MLGEACGVAKRGFRWLCTSLKLVNSWILMVVWKEEMNLRTHKRLEVKAEIPAQVFLFL